VKVVGSTLDHTFMMRPHVIAHPISAMKVRDDILYGGAMLGK